MAEMILSSVFLSILFYIKVKLYFSLFQIELEMNLSQNVTIGCGSHRPER